MTAVDSTPKDTLGAIETRGIEPVTDGERHGRARDLTWVWFAANIGILGITVGAALVTFRALNIWQTLLVAIIGGAGSFALVGVLSIAGKWGGAPGLTLSRAAFGVRGNAGPVVLSWITLVGWEAVMSITAACAFRSLMRKVLHTPENNTTTIIALAIVVVLTAVIGLLGHATIMWVQKWATYIFGAFTVVLIGFLVTHVDWNTAIRAPGAPLTAVIAAIGFIAAGTGIGWINAGADYARYLPQRESGRSITTV